MYRSVRAKLLFVSLTTLVVALMVNAALDYFIGIHYNTITISQNLNALENAHAAAIGEWVSTRKLMVRTLREAVLKPDPLPWISQIAQAGGFMNAAVGWADKRYMQTLRGTIIPGFDPTVRPWYQQAVNAIDVVVTKPYTDVSSGRLMVAFAAPVVQEGAVTGVTYASVRMDAVKSNVESIHPTPSSYGALVDGDGVVIAYPNSQFLGKNLATSVPGLDAVLKANDSEPHALRIDDVPKLARVQAIDGTNWRLIIVLDEAEAAAAMRSQLVSSTVALILIVAIAAILMSLLTTIVLKRLSAIRNAMEEIASGDGDLTLRIPIHGQDELAGISIAFNRFVETLLHVMKQVRENSEAVRIAATQIAAGNQDLAGRTEAAAGSVSRISASVDRIVSMISQSTESAVLANSKSRYAKDVAAKGGEAVIIAIDTMRAIESAASSIGAIITVIDSIAFQTNILALNAAVEAARAGESGRGFAVVAEEVRELANRSAQAAKEIKGLIDGTTRSVESGSVQVNFVGDTVRNIVLSIQKVATIIDEIAAATHAQTSGIAEVEQSILTLDEVIQHNAALVEESAAAAESLRSQADSLSAEVANFKLD